MQTEKIRCRSTCEDVGLAKNKLKFTSGKYFLTPPLQSVFILLYLWDAASEIDSGNIKKFLNIDLFLMTAGNTSVESYE